MILWLARVDDYCAGLTSAVLLSCGDEQLCWGWVPRQDPCFCGRLTALLAFNHGGRSRAFRNFCQNSTKMRPSMHYNFWQAGWRKGKGVSKPDPLPAEACLTAARQNAGRVRRTVTMLDGTP